MSSVPRNASSEDEPVAVELDYKQLLGFRTLPSRSADAAATDIEEELKLLHNKVGFGELPPDPTG